MKRRQFLALFALGLVGVVSLLPVAVPAIARLQLPANAPPRPVILLLSMLQPAILVAVAVAVGVRLAPPLGFRSYVAEAAADGAPVRPALRRDAPLAIGVGVATMLVVLLLDLAFRPFMGEAWRRLEATSATAAHPGAALAMGMLYGGITEEILLRWGMMSLLAWLGWRFTGPAAGAPRPAVVWTAIIISALIFGAGHLPAVSAAVPLTTVVTIRTILLNGLAGVAFGWLFWRRSLEAAMVAHASGHVVIFAARLLAG